MSEPTVALPQSQSLSILRRLLLAVLTLGLGTIAALWGIESRRLDAMLSRLSAFHITEVRVRSEWPLVPETVRNWLPTLEGTSLLVLKPESLILQLKGKPWVENVAVKKEFPSRVFIDVETKRPHAITLIKNETYFLDGQGQPIEKATPALLKALDLPFVTREKNSQSWNVGEFLVLLENIKKTLGSHYVVSQYVLGGFPFFKLYLASPKIEVMMSFENWEAQLQILLKLLANPPSQIGQLQRINLVFPKKAVVRPLNPH